MERRAVTSPCELRQNDDGTKQIEGYAAVFYRQGDPGTEFELWDDLVERIDPKAFDGALKRKDDAAALFNHQPDNLLGRVSSKSLTLTVDKTGLRYVVPFDEEDPDHMRVARKIERGDLAGSSFAFRATKAEWSVEGDREVRTIKEVELYDVGPVTYPAYKSTTAATRSEHTEARQEYDAWKEHRQAESEEQEQAEQQRIADELDNLERRLRLIKAGDRA